MTSPPQKSNTSKGFTVKDIGTISEYKSCPNSMTNATAVEKVKSKTRAQRIHSSAGPY